MLHFFDVTSKKNYREIFYLGRISNFGHAEPLNFLVPLGVEQTYIPFSVTATRGSSKLPAVSHSSDLKIRK